MKKRNLNTILFLFVLSPTFLNAEEALPEEEESVETVAPRLQSNFYKTRKTGTITERQLEASPSLSSALDQQSGIEVQETNRGGGSVFIRGLIGPENLILIDGLRFNQSTFRTGPNQYLDTIGLSAISDVDTINGPAGLLFGSNAIGGVINLKTNSKLEDHHFALANLSFDSARSGISALFKTAIATKNTTLRLGLNYGREGTLGTAPGPFLMAALTEDGQYLGTSFQRLGWSVGVENQTTKTLKLSARYLGSKISDAPRLDRLGTGRVRVADNEDHFGYLRAQISDALFFDSLSFALMFHSTNEVQNKFRCKVFAGHARRLRGCARRRVDEIIGQKRNEDSVSTLGASSSGTIGLHELLSLNVGGDFYRDLVSSQASKKVDGGDESTRANFPEGASYLSAGLFSLLSFEIYSDLESVIEIQGGIRGDIVHANAADVPGLGPVEYTQLAPVGSLNLSYLSQSFTSWLGWHQGFRPPNLQETMQIGDTGTFFEIPNRDLKPERSNSFEIGAKVFQKHLGQFSGSLFVNLINNKITRSPASFEGKNEIDEKEVRQRINEGDAYYYGLEADWNSNPFYNISINANLSILDGAVSSQERDETFEAGFLHSLLKSSQFYQNPRRLAPLSYRLALRFEKANFSSSFWVRGNGTQGKISKDDRKDLRICESSPGIFSQQCQGTQDWLTLNIETEYKFEKIGLRLGIENLLNARYRRHGSGVPGAGFSVKGSIRLEI